jgi:hypothetical protein
MFHRSIRTSVRNLIVLAFFFNLVGIILLCPSQVFAQEDPASPTLDTIQIIEIAGPSSDPTAVITDTSLSPREIIEAWERADAEAGVADERQEPYTIIGVALDYQASTLFLPLVAGGEEGSVAASPQVWLGERGRPLTLEEIEFNMEISHQYMLIGERDLKALQARVEAALVDAAGTEQIDSALAVVYMNKTVGGINTIKEPDLNAYRNYCGPGSISVAIDAIFPLSSVPSMDSIANTIRNYQAGAWDDYVGGWWVNGAFYKHFDPAVGTSGAGLCRYIHDYFNANFTYRYMLRSTSTSLADKNVFWTKIGAHVERNYTLVTGTNTTHLKGWGRRPNTPHINAAIGYEAYVTNGWWYDMRNVRYAETASPAAGYDGGEFKTWWDSAKFLSAVNANNVQCALDPQFIN